MIIFNRTLPLHILIPICVAIENRYIIFLQLLRSFYPTTSINIKMLYITKCKIKKKQYRILSISNFGCSNQLAELVQELCSSSITSHTQKQEENFIHLKSEGREPQLNNNNNSPIHKLLHQNPTLPIHFDNGPHPTAI